MFKRTDTSSEYYGERARPALPQKAQGFPNVLHSCIYLTPFPEKKVCAERKVEKKLSTNTARK